MADLRIASLSYAVRFRVVAKWFGCAAFLRESPRIGRLEMVAILIVLYPNTWIGRRSDSL